ncbi:MAG: flagellar biosynthesis protein FlhB [Oscillospiraceae bacterium]|jgi:flagellar biosynthetic protein FlhB|nr:flagellar biosynthesis protein FlhB [Oscillospiraceae bacterium]
MPGGEKTERATPKRRKEARERGQVLKSTEANVAVSCVVMIGLMLIIMPRYVEQLAGLYSSYLSGAALAPSESGITVTDFQQVFYNASLSMLSILLPILAASFLAAIASNVMQVGFLFTTKNLTPKLENISPIKGFKRIFSIRTLVELLKSMLKIGILGYIAYSEYTKNIEKFPTLIGQSVYDAFVGSLELAFNLALKMSLALVAIAAADYLFQWWKYEKDLRMTKQEVKDEFKQMEGDPQIKGKIRQKQRQMSAMRMMEKVPTADVVITNPTHFAVALKYETGVDAAPMVVAKGQDFLARRIKEKAREFGVELVENRPLAQALYAYCDIGDEIPEEFYQAVADILVYIYRNKHGSRTGRR